MFWTGLFDWNFLLLHGYCTNTETVRRPQTLIVRYEVSDDTQTKKWTSSHKENVGSCFTCTHRQLTLPSPPRRAACDGGNILRLRGSEQRMASFLRNIEHSCCLTTCSNSHGWKFDSGGNRGGRCQQHSLCVEINDAWVAPWWPTLD